MGMITLTTSLGYWRVIVHVIKVHLKMFKGRAGRYCTRIILGNADGKDATGRGSHMFII